MSSDNRRHKVTGGSVGPTRHLFFKFCIAGSTLLLLAAVVSLSPLGRYLVLRTWRQAAAKANQGRVRSIEEKVLEREMLLQLELDRGAIQVGRTVDKTFNRSPEDRRRFLRLAGLASRGSPEETAVIAKGINLNWVGVLSGRVFMEDAAGPQSLPYVLRPNTRSLWVGPHNAIAETGMLAVPLLPDDPDVREAAPHHGMSASEDGSLAGSPHTSNSWGLRGPEPNPLASARVMLLGDSYMHGFGVADDDSPAAFLQKHLAEILHEEVSVLNTSVSGYGPKEYYLSLEKYADRFNPHIIVVCVCSNDFGQSTEVYDGKGDDWQRAGFYLRKIRSACQAREIPCVFCPAPEPEVIRRREVSYTDRLAQLLEANSSELFSTIDAFATENMRMLQERRAAGGEWTDRSLLHLEDQGDGHLNPQGANIWGRELATRVALLMKLRDFGAAQQ